MGSLRFRLLYFSSILLLSIIFSCLISSSSVLSILVKEAQAQQAIESNAIFD
jgi:uncharacterized membrane protein